MRVCVRKPFIMERNPPITARRSPDHLQVRVWAHWTKNRVQPPKNHQDRRWEHTSTKMIKYWDRGENDVCVEGNEGMRARAEWGCSSGAFRWNPLDPPAAAASHLYKIWIWCLTGTVCSVALKKRVLNLFCRCGDVKLWIRRETRSPGAVTPPTPSSLVPFQKNVNHHPVEGLSLISMKQ